MYAIVVNFILMGLKTVRKVSMNIDKLFLDIFNLQDSQSIKPNSQDIYVDFYSIYLSIFYFIAYYTNINHNFLNVNINCIESGYNNQSFKNTSISLNKLTDKLTTEIENFTDNYLNFFYILSSYKNTIGFITMSIGGVIWTLGDLDF